MWDGVWLLYLASDSRDLLGASSQGSFKREWHGNTASDTADTRYLEMPTALAFTWLISND